MFDELPIITAVIEGSTVSVNQMQHVYIKLDYDEINGL